MIDSLPENPLSAERRAQVAVCSRRTRIEADCLAKVPSGAFQVALRGDDLTQIVVRRGESRLEPD